MNQHLNDKIRGSLLGGAIGDALGYQIEFEKGIKEKQVTKYKNDFGIISDDTQMTLFTATALIWRETRLEERGIAMTPAEAVYYGYLDWYDTQKGKGDQGIASVIKEIWMNMGNGGKDNESISWIKEIPELHVRRAPGNTCLTALRSGKMGTIEKPINNSKGCGGIMRIVPCGVIQDPHKAGELAAQCAAITHGHSLAIIPSYMCAAMISMLLYRDITIKEAVSESFELTKENKHIFENKSNRSLEDDMKVFVDLIEKAILLSKENISDIDAIAQLGKGFVGEDALAIAVYSCLKYPNSFEDAVVCAVNHDGDSDSTGAIAGNILGAKLGLSSIPEYYVHNVELKDIVLEIADDLTTITENDESKLQEDVWIKKYVYCQLGHR